MVKSRLLSVATLCCALLSPSGAAAEDDMASAIEGMLRSAEEEYHRMEGRAAMEPAGIGEAWRHRVAAARKVVEFYREALDAAKLGDAAGREASRRKAEDWRRCGYNIRRWISAETEALGLRHRGPGAGEKEEEYRRRMLALFEEVREMYSQAQAGGDEPDVNALNAISREAEGRMRQAGSLRQVVAALRGKSELLRRRDGEENEKLRALFEERLRLQDALIALAEQTAAARAGADHETIRKLAQRRAELGGEIRAWETLYRARREEVRYEKEAAEMPPELRPLAKRMLDYRREAARIEAKLAVTSDRGREADRLESRAEAFEIRADAIETILRARGEAAEIAEEAAEVGHNRAVKALLARSEDVLAEYERMVREFAELAVAAAELESRAEAREEAADDFLETVDMVLEQLADAVERAVELREAGLDLGDPNEARRFRERLRRDLEQFDAEFAELGKTAASHVGTVRRLLEGAGTHAEKGLELIAAGKAREAEEELSEALEAAELAQKMRDILAWRARMERQAAALGDAAGGKSIREALGDFRRRAEEATRLAIEAARVTAGGAGLRHGRARLRHGRARLRPGGAGAEEIVARHEEAARAGAAMRQAAAELDRLIGKARREAEEARGAPDLF